MIAGSDVTVVLQGALPDAAGLPALQANLAALRAALPGAAVVFSTWQGCDWPAGISVDQAVFSPDPGALPAYKVGRCKTNNVNRQIVSSAAGLAAVRTPYALKLRCDARLSHRGALDWLAWLQRHDGAGPGRIITAGHFCVEPRLFEQMPFHLSDWFQFGATARLQQLWQAPLMTLADATHYERQPHAAHSTLFDRRFIARWPAEQFVWRAFAQSLGYHVPDFHNDVSPAVLAEHDRFLATEVAILDLAQAGLQVPALAWAARSGMQRFNCLNHVDWLALAAQQQQWRLRPAQQQAIARRQRAKALVGRAFSVARPLLPALVVPPLKRVVSLALKGADAWSRSSPLPWSPTEPFLQTHSS